MFRREKKKGNVYGERAPVVRFQLSAITPFSGPDTLNPSSSPSSTLLFFSSLFRIPSPSHLDETCNQNLLSKMRNDRVKVSEELTIWEWRFGPAHEFRGLAITFHVPFRHKSEPTDVIRELLLSSFIP